MFQPRALPKLPQRGPSAAGPDKVEQTLRAQISQANSDIKALMLEQKTADSKASASESELNKVRETMVNTIMGFKGGSREDALAELKELENFQGDAAKLAPFQKKFVETYLAWESLRAAAQTLSERVAAAKGTVATLQGKLAQRQKQRAEEAKAAAARRLAEARKREQEAARREQVRRETAARQADAKVKDQAAKILSSQLGGSGGTGIDGVVVLLDRLLQDNQRLRTEFSELKSSLGVGSAPAAGRKKDPAIPAPAERAEINDWKQGVFEIKKAQRRVSALTGTLHAEVETLEAYGQDVIKSAREAFLDSKANFKRAMAAIGDLVTQAERLRAECATSSISTGGIKSALAAAGGLEPLLKLTGGFEAMVKSAGGFKTFLRSVRGFRELLSAAGGLDNLLAKIGGFKVLLRAAGGLPSMVKATGLGNLVKACGGLESFVDLSGGLDGLVRASTPLLDTLPDEAFEADSVYDEEYEPFHIKFGADGQYGWAPEDGRQTSCQLTIDLQGTKSIVAIETRCGNDADDEACEEFILEQSADGKTFEQVSEEPFRSPGGVLKPTMLPGGVATTRFVRIKPIAYCISPCMKVELYGFAEKPGTLMTSKRITAIGGRGMGIQITRGMLQGLKSRGGAQTRKKVIDLA